MTIRCTARRRAERRTVVLAVDVDLRDARHRDAGGGVLSQLNGRARLHLCDGEAVRAAAAGATAGLRQVRTRSTRCSLSTSRSACVRTTGDAYRQRQCGATHRSRGSCTPPGCPPRRPGTRRAACTHGLVRRAARLAQHSAHAPNGERHNTRVLVGAAHRERLAAARGAVCSRG